MFFFPVDRRINDRVPWVVFLLLAVNVAVFMVTFWGYDLRPGGRVERIYEAHAAIVADLQVHRWFTHMFLHGGAEHLVGNLLFLVFFGMNVERKLGPAATLAIYVVSGLGALFLFAAFNPGSKVPLVGASGAISGLVGMYLALFPRRAVEVLWYAIAISGMVRIPVVVMAGLWAGMEVLQSVLFNAMATVAHWAHVGGFLAGGLAVLGLRLAGVKGHAETYGPPGEEPAAPDRFEEMNYIPLHAGSRPAGRPDTAMRRRGGESNILVARSWVAPGPAHRREIDAILPGAGAFATAACLARGLALPQADDLGRRLERLGVATVAFPERTLLQRPPLVVAKALAADARGIVVRDAAGLVRSIPASAVYLLGAGSVRRGDRALRVLDLLATGPWVCVRLSEAAAEDPDLAAAARRVRGVAEKAPATTAFMALAEGRACEPAFAAMDELDDYHQWVAQVMAGSQLGNEDGGRGKN